MRSPRVPVEEQYRLIMECRKSGMSDYQWCLNNDINPGTFYNWIKRMRQSSCYEIPERNQLAIDHHVSGQEVVKIEMDTACCDIGQRQKATDSFMSLTIGNVKLSIPNGTDPNLLSQTLKILAEYVC